MKYKKKVERVVKESIEESRTLTLPFDPLLGDAHGN